MRSLLAFLDAWDALAETKALIEELRFVLQSVRSNCSSSFAPTHGARPGGPELSSIRTVEHPS